MRGGSNLTPYIIYLEVYLSISLSLSLSMYINPIWNMPKMWSISP